MKAAILTQLKKPLVVADIVAPAPGYGQVLVKINFSGLCGSQLGEIAGVKGKDSHLPHLLGHEGSGVALETGFGVTKVKPGDRVVLHWRKGAGIESAVPLYHWRGRPVNAGWVTTFNEVAVVSENRLTPIPKDFDPAQAALLGCAVTTGLGVINNDARLKAGESIVVFGAGGVGLSVIQAAALASAYPIVAVDINAQKLSLAKKLGATHLINSKNGGLRQAVENAVGSSGADVTVDNTGVVEIIEAAYELARPQGRAILVGVPMSPIRVDSLPLHFGKIITGSHGGQANPTEDIPRCLRLCRAGRLRLKDMITGRFELKDINRALAILRQGGTAGRILIKMP